MGPDLLIAFVQHERPDLVPMIPIDHLPFGQGNQDAVDLMDASIGASTLGRDAVIVPLKHGSIPAVPPGMKLMTLQSIEGIP
jgi:hypothetical protein